MSLSPVAKTALPLLLIPEMFSDSNALPMGLAGIGLYSIPNTMLLWNVYTQHPRATRLWRTITLFADGAITLAFAGFGTYVMIGESRLGGWGDVIGALYLFLAIPAGAAFALDFIPYSFETTE